MIFPILKRLSKCFVTAAFVLCASSALMAQTYPSKPITIKIAFAAGGAADASFRAAAVVLHRYLGQSFIPENVPGATGSISAMAVLKSNPDGYTLLGTTGPDFAIAPLMVASAKYEPESFRLLGVTGASDLVLISNTTHSFRNVDELIDYAKTQGNQPLTLGHWGKGSTAHIVSADFQARTGTVFLEIPYKGGAPALTDIAGQHLDLTFAPLGASTLDLILSGKVKAIAVASDRRHLALPDVPTINESTRVKNFEYSVWSGLFAPPGTPEPISDRLTNALQEWTSSPENLARINLNLTRRLEPMNATQAAAFFKTEREKFRTIIHQLKLQSE